MSNTAQNPATPQLVSLRTIAVEGEATFDWHVHPFDEFTLVADDNCQIAYPPGWRNAARNTLFHYHVGERHGARVLPGQHPRFWVVHFTADSDICAQSKQLGSDDAEKRVWTLTHEQSETFKWIFVHLLNEHSSQRSHRRSAVSAWLQLLLVNVERWGGRSGESVIPTPTGASDDVLRLWHLINAAVGKSNEEIREIYAAPNYDSVRHAFRKTFGCSPREMLQRLRVEHAKNLLLETSLSIKEISLRVGYVQQHDFNRMFQRYTGMAPSKWRSNPLESSAGP